MFRRIINLPQSHSFFLFGARGTGKTSLLQMQFSSEQVLWLDLLSAHSELQFLENPDSLSEIITKKKPAWVVIDEVQKVPKLLDIVHREIGQGKTNFALTGSSARKLKRGGANLLAGRAFVFHLFPLSYLELGEEFDLESVMQWGSLPQLFRYRDQGEKKLFLSNYVDVYLKEEVFAEQLVRGIAPFRKFLKLAAQSNGTLLNYKRIGDDISVDIKTVQNYFDILEDTLLGFYLPATEISFRKQQVKAPKFYLLDCGVQRAIEGVHHLPIVSAQEFGRVFEHWLITEIHKLNLYSGAKYELSHLRNKSGLEIDLVLTVPRQQPILVEIKSTRHVQDQHLHALAAIRSDYPQARFLCLSRDPMCRIKEGMEILYWKDGIRELGLN